MRAYLLFVAIISFQVALSMPPISKDDLNFEMTNSKLNRLEPEKELDIVDREYSLGEVRSADVAHQSRNDSNINYDANDAENEIEDENSYDSFSEKIDDENDTLSPAHETYYSDVKTVIHAFMNLVPKNTTFAQVFRQIAAMLKTDPDESTKIPS